MINSSEILYNRKVLGKKLYFNIFVRLFKTASEAMGVLAMTDVTIKPFER